MKLEISELCSGCCPENVTLGTSDAELTARIKAKTLKKIGVQPTRRRVRVRTLLLAAAIAAFFGSAACWAHNRDKQKRRGSERQNVVFPGCRSAADLHGSRREL